MQSTEKVKSPSTFRATRRGSIRSLLKIPVEWQILFALLALMGLRLVTIIVVVLKQL